MLTAPALPFDIICHIISAVDTHTLPNVALCSKDCNREAGKRIFSSIHWNPNCIEELIDGCEILYRAPERARCVRTLRLSLSLTTFYPTDPPQAKHIESRRGLLPGTPRDDGMHLTAEDGVHESVRRMLCSLAGLKVLVLLVESTQQAALFCRDVLTLCAPVLPFQLDSLSTNVYPLDGLDTFLEHQNSITALKLMRRLDAGIHTVPNLMPKDVLSRLSSVWTESAGILQAVVEGRPVRKMRTEFRLDGDVGAVYRSICASTVPVQDIEITVMRWEFLIEFFELLAGHRPSHDSAESSVNYEAIRLATQPNASSDALGGLEKLTIMIQGEGSLALKNDLHTVNTVHLPPLHALNWFPNLHTVVWKGTLTPRVARHPWNYVSNQADSMLNNVQYLVGGPLLKIYERQPVSEGAKEREWVKQDAALFRRTVDKRILKSMEYQL